MRKRDGLLALIASALLFLGQSASSGSRPSPSSGASDAAELLTLLRGDSYLAAAKLADRMLGDPALSPEGQALCGLAMLKAGRIAEAETILGRAISLKPDCPEAHLGLGRIGRIRNDNDSAITHFLRAVESEAFHEEAFRQLWRAVWDRGRVAELKEVRALAAERFARDAKLLPTWISNGLAQIEGLSGRGLFRMEGSAERVEVPLVATDPRLRFRMVSLGLNGRGDYLFHLDSALADFMTLSPLLAEELGLVPVGSATSSGVGTATIATRFAVLDEVRLGPLTFHDVPVMVSDVRTLRGLKQGLVGTAFLKRFNATIDAEAGTMELYPLERPDLMAARIDGSAVAADVPLYLFDQTVVEASLAGAPSALYILDTAAATNLVDRPFFEEHIKPKLDPARIVRGGIRGAGGAQYVNQVEGLTVALDTLVFDDQQANEFPMDTLNTIGGRYAAGLLGNPVLWPYRVHLDFKNGRLILEKRPKAQSRLKK
jgi:hypothetical protein